MLHLRPAPARRSGAGQGGRFKDKAFQHCVPVAVLDIRRSHVDAVPPGILNKLRGRIEAHRLRVHEPDRRLLPAHAVVVEPLRHSRAGEARGMRIGNPASPKFDLDGRWPRRIRASNRVRACRRSVGCGNVRRRRVVSAAIERRRWSAAGRESGSYDGELHYLFPEYRYAKCSLQDGFDSGRRVVHRPLP